MITVFAVEFIVETENHYQALTLEEISLALQTRGYNVELVENGTRDNKCRFFVRPGKYLVDPSGQRFESEEE